MKRVLALVLALAALLLCGCDAVLDALATPSTIDILPTAAQTIVPIPTVYEGYCSWVWDNRPLPDVTAALMQAMRDAGISGVEGEAVAYGEMCVDMVSNGVVEFIPRQTNYVFRLTGLQPDQERSLGEWTEKLLAVIENFAPQGVPGTQRGSITYQLGDDARPLSFSHERARDFVRDGLRAADLWRALMP